MAVGEGLLRAREGGAHKLLVLGAGLRAPQPWLAWTDGLEASGWLARCCDLRALTSSKD